MTLNKMQGSNNQQVNVVEFLVDECNVDPETVSQVVVYFMQHES